MANAALIIDYFCWELNPSMGITRDPFLLPFFIKFSHFIFNIFNDQFGQFRREFGNKDSSSKNRLKIL